VQGPIQRTGIDFTTGLVQFHHGHPFILSSWFRQKKRCLQHDTKGHDKRGYDKRVQDKERYEKGAGNAPHLLSNDAASIGRGERVWVPTAN
jgi:hypothetical protein